MIEGRGKKKTMVAGSKRNASSSSTNWSVVTRGAAAKKLKEEGERNGDLFRLLPDEMLVEIFSFLVDAGDIFYGTAGVNRRFRSLSTFHVTELHNSYTAGQHRLRGREPPVTPFLRLATRLGRLTMNLNMTAASKPKMARFVIDRKPPPPTPKELFDMESAIFAALEHCPVLKSLRLVNFHDNSVHPRDVGKLCRAIGSHGASLRELSLGHMGNFEHFDPTHLRNLTSLGIGHCSPITDATLPAIAENCRALESFRFEGKEDLSKETVEGFLRGVKGTLRELLWHGLNIGVTGGFMALGECLRLEKLSLESWQGDLESDILESILQLPKLTELIVGGFAVADGVSALLKGKVSPNLTSLTIFESGPYNDALLSAVARSCPGLLELNLIDNRSHEMTDDGLRRFSEKFGKGKLERMLIRCLGDDARRMAAPLLEFKGRVPSLKSLRVCCCLPFIPTYLGDNLSSSFKRECVIPYLKGYPPCVVYEPPAKAQ